jgi:hypothetical protein
MAQQRKCRTATRQHSSVGNGGNFSKKAAFVPNREGNGLFAQKLFWKNEIEPVVPPIWDRIFQDSE